MAGTLEEVKVAGRLSLKWYLYSQHNALIYIMCLWTLLWAMCAEASRAASPWYSTVQGRCSLGVLFPE